MTITREDVADLHPGDVVQIASGHWPAGTLIRGPLRMDSDGWLICADYPVRLDNGEPGGADRDVLALIERGPRLYVNHARGIPVPNDIAGDADDRAQRTVWISSGITTDGDQLWVNAEAEWCYRADLPARLRLLVDGETGQVVP